MSAWEAHGDELIARILDGDLSVDDVEVREYAAGSEDFESRLAEAQAVLAELKDAATLEREVLEEARSTRPEPGDERVEPTVQALMQGRGPPHRVIRRWPWVLPSVAAALLVGLWLMQRQDEPSGALRTDPGQQLREDSLRLLRPAVEDASFEVFEWRGTAPDLGSFVLRIEGDGLPDNLPIVLRTTETRWVDETGRLRGAGDEIRWEVAIEDVDGTVLERSERTSRR